jgi:2-polyprenyl-3-methyl-5-hydroxy-6-metoxy-1,4-benzoquinol methylase
MTKDEVAQYNRARWTAMARAEALFTRPFLDLTVAAARDWIDSDARLPDVSGKRVLCLASGGGRQSACFCVLGAAVTVLDLADEVLQGDRLVAEQYGVPLRIEQGDMRDLSRFSLGEFDIIYQPYSINFVPDVRVVFREVARVLRPGGSYILMCANPYALGIASSDWTGEGYLLRHPYVEGAMQEYTDERWVYHQGSTPIGIPAGRQYRHTLAAVINGLAEHGLIVEHLTEETMPIEGTTPGDWHHLVATIPPWLTLWTRLTTTIGNTSPTLRG